MPTIDTKNIKQLEKVLKKYRKKALPFAQKNTLNNAAFETMKNSKKVVAKKFINRNKWTVKSIRVNKVAGMNPRTMKSAVGSLHEYMATQEFGGTKTKPAIQTSYSSGEGESAKPRKKLPRRSNKLANIQLRNKRRKGKNSRQKNLIAVREAAKSGDKFVYLERLKRNKKGIFKVIGGKRRPRVKMVADLSKQSVKIKRRPWLMPSVNRTGKRMPEIYRKQLKAQVIRHGLVKPI